MGAKRLADARRELQIVDRSGAMWVSRPDGALLTYRDGALKVAVPASARAGADVIEDGAGRVLVWQRRAFQLWVWRNERLEPWRLARELHDTLLQGFTGIVLQLEGLRHLRRHSHGPSAEQLSRILTLADSTLFDARQSVWDMRSKSLEDRSLAEAIQETAVGLTTGSPVAVRFATRGDPRTLAPTAQAAMLHIGREALRNAVHHQRAGCGRRAAVRRRRDATGRQG